jgi:hypothetical protein
MKRLFLLMSLLGLLTAVGYAQKGKHTISISVSDKGNNEPVVMATIQLQPAGALAVTDMDGKAFIKNVPDGEYSLQITYVGFEPINTKVKVNKDLQMKFALTPTSLSLKEE